MDNSKNSMNNDKSLCLYCDKAFSNINDQENHVERDHKTVLNKSKGSLRKSERITKNLCSENSPFAACFYCNNKKLIKSDDLESLFQHLLTAHKDIYFGCKCKTRLLDKVSLANHKKNCELGGGGSSKLSDEKINEKRKSTKTSQSKVNIDSKCDTLSDSTVISATAAPTNHSVKTLPTNAINKKSDRSNVKNSNNKNVVNSNEKRNNNNNNYNNNSNNNNYNSNSNNSNHNKKGKISNSSSSSTISTSSSSKTIDEYTIPLTRQKLKEPSSGSSKQSSSSQSRSSSNKKVQKNSRSSSSTNENKSASSLHASTSSTSSSPTKVQRTKTTKIISHNSQNNCELVENTQKSEILSAEFDEDFYKNISYNIRVNLNCFIDGKDDRLQLNRPVFDRISTQENVHDVKQPNEIPNHDEKEIHEATNFELSTPFPALLTAEQYGFGDSNPKNKRQITKNSWKWKWDLIKKYKYVNEGGKIVKKVKQITTGLKDLSQLDMWTQLSMRSRYENLNNQNGSTEFDDGLKDNLSMRMIKTQNIEQLNCILDKRSIPEINIEQLQQTLVKEEPIEAEDIGNNIDECEDESKREEAEVLGMLNLAKVDAAKETHPALSGEWARPRRFVCIDCGQEFDLMKSLTDHKNSEHPYVVSAHYEVVGRENLEQKLYKNLFLPKKALHAKGNVKSLSINSDSKSNEASCSSENSSSNYLTDQKEKECSKCMKIIKYSNDIDVYRHILDCIEDRVWMQAKRRNKYRRSRRKTKKAVKKTRLPIDQKKNTSSPFTKEIIEGDTSLSNPPTPKEDIQKPIIAKNKNETYVSDDKSNKDGMNIKSFFRVSKTTPNLPQKIVVQMIEMHQNTHNNNTLRHSLRSSARKLSTNPQANTKSQSNNDDISSKATESNPHNNIEDANLNEETIKEESKIDVENTKIDNNSSADTTKIVKHNIPPALTALQIPDSDKMKSLSSPTNSSTSSLVSPTCSVPKKKKKLNDCIAMLTCKIQEKLGVNFFESISTEIFPNEPEPKKLDENNTNTAICCRSITLPSFPNLTITPVPIPVEKKIPNVPQASFVLPEQDEVIDLSIKKKSCEKQIINVTISNANESQNSHTETKCEEINVDSSIPKCDEAVKEESEKEPEQIGCSLKELEKCNKFENNTIQETNIEETCVKDNEKVEETIQEELAPIKISDITESFKISISKDRIPNLNEILENNSVITVNNLKISDAERRAFEEQKNRIMQILNKSKKTTGKKIVKKAVQKKQPAKKNAKQQQLKDIQQSDKEKIENESSKVLETIIMSDLPIESIVKEEEPKVEQESESTKTKKESEKPIEPAETKVLYDFPGSETPERLPDEKSAIVEKPPETVIEANIKNKIEQAIKTTNRIRCRRLSVVVDPIIHLSPFQQSNRKIRLTNNSQQNGLYDLLTNDQLFNAIKPQLKDEIKKTCAKVTGTKASKSIQSAINEVRAAAAKTNQVKESPESTLTSKNVKSKVTAKSNKKTAAAAQKYKNKKKFNTRNNKAILKKELEKNVEKVLVKNIKKNPIRSKQPVKTKKVPIELPKPVIEELKPIPIESPVQPQKPKIEEKEAIKPSKTPAKKKGSKNKAKQKKSIVKESIVENEKVEEAKEIKKPEESLNGIENITPAMVVEEKLDEKLSLDISLSSDTSNENDIPLAKLVNISKDKVIKENDKLPDEKDPIIEKIPLRSSNKKKPPVKKVSRGKTQNKPRSKIQNIKTHKVTVEDEILNKETINKLNENDDEKILELKAEIPVEIKIDIAEEIKVIDFEEEIKKECEKPKKSLDNKSKPPESISAKTKVEKENRDKLEVFNINEDSFFNDDNDADEKINDLVNNIINSSELGDSETEKNDQHKQNSNAEAKCLICKRTFRNEKVLEKHNKTTTHLFKVKRREKRIADQKEKVSIKKDKDKVSEKDIQKQIDNQANTASSCDETKIFRTKGALKTFENILTYPENHTTETINYEVPKDFIPAVSPERTSIIPFESVKKIDTYEFDEDDDKNEDLSRKDKIFDSLFSNIENKLQAAAAAASNSAPPLQKYTFPTLTPHDSEIESSSTSWDLKHDADIEWDADNNDNNQPAITNAIKEKYPKKSSIKINKSKETAISIPTKSLIMGKIFKKHRDREKQKTPQADAPNNKPGIKNSLDEIFDHLKNSAEIDDKVLTCPSPKTLLKSSGGTFSPHSSHSNDMLETASQSNNNNNSSNNNSSNSNNNNLHSMKPTLSSIIQDQSSAASSNEKKAETLSKNEKTNDDEEDGIGKRKSRRRCAIKAKTFAETWSSDEYEELHDTNDIISIINEIEKRESIKKRKVSKSESHFVDNNVSKKNENVEIPTTTESNQNHKPILKSNETTAVVDKKSTQQNDKNEKKKSVQLQFPTSDIFSKEKEKPVNTIRKRRMSTLKDGHKSDEETFTATKDLKPLKPTISMMKKRRMSCFVPSSIFNDSLKSQANNKTVKNNAIPATISSTTKTAEVVSKTKIDKDVDHKEGLSDVSEKCGKNQKKILSAVCNNSNSTTTKAKKVQKHRKRHRNKVKNIAYDSDSDFELNLSRKSKASGFSDSYSEEEADGDDITHTLKTNITSQNALVNSKSSNINDSTMIKEPKLLPNDLNVVPTTTPVKPAKAAIQEDISDPTQSACNRTKRHSSEKLYYWSSSSEESDVEPGDTADGENEDSMIPQQPEQHGWIVGDSHKKLVTLLAHAKIKNKIN